MKQLLPMQPKADMTDEELVAGLKSAAEPNKKRQLEIIFYKRYVNYIYQAASYKCRYFEEAEQLAKDLTQDIFIKVFHLIHSFEFKPGVPIEDHPALLKAWMGIIADNGFKKVYAARKKETHITDSTATMDDIMCPICGKFLLFEGKYAVCITKHYKVEADKLKVAEEIPDSQYTTDLNDLQHEEADIEISNEFKIKFQEAMNTLNEKQKHILTVYAGEGCFNSKQHISDESLKQLCSFYGTTPDTIKHIKNRAFKKIKEICTSTLT